jgi:hypothetical protein
MDANDCQDCFGACVLPCGIIHGADAVSIVGEDEFRMLAALSFDDAPSGIIKDDDVANLASTRGWLAPEFLLPDDGFLFTLFGRKEALPAMCISTLEPWREQVTKWHAAGIQGSTIHAALVRNHGYTGSYSSMYRFLGANKPIPSTDQKKLSSN